MTKHKNIVTSSPVYYCREVIIVSVKDLGKFDRSLVQITVFLERGMFYPDTGLFLDKAKIDNIANTATYTLGPMFSRRPDAITTYHLEQCEDNTWFLITLEHKKEVSRLNVKVEADISFK